MPNLPSAVKQRIKDFTAKFPIPQGNPSDPTWDDTIRTYTLKICSQITNDFGVSYGAKRADSGRPISKDSLAFTPSADGLWSWDLFIGTGTGQPRLADEPSFNDIPDQVFVAVTPHDYIGGTAPGPDPIPPVDGGDHELILAELALINQKLDDAKIQQAADTQKLYDQMERIFANLTAQIADLKAQKAHLRGTMKGSVLGGGTVEMVEV